MLSAASSEIREAYNGTATATDLFLVDLGLIDYSAAWEIQKERLAAVIQGSAPQTLFLCSHPAVITVGKGGKDSNILAPQDVLRERGIAVHRTERGGDVTYHGPEQLIAYPILNLQTKRRDVGWYMRSLEEVILQVLLQFGIQGDRIPGKTGVWILNQASSKKIASLGVRLSRWCTMHGVSLNRQDCREGFSHIHPCGLVGAEVTSIEEQAGTAPSYDIIAAKFVESFCKVFEYSIAPTNRHH